MQYGYFDDAAKEYVITRPDTPRSWSNYLGSTEYGAIITNNAGGYGFYRSGARGRFLRLRFNAVPVDRRGVPSTACGLVTTGRACLLRFRCGWGVMAECMLGNGDRAYKYYRAAMPAAYNDHAEMRQSEPYVQGQTTYSIYSPRAGTTRTPWLTGAAAWAYFSATQYILGLRPEPDGLRIDPCIPSTWAGFKATRRFRGRTIQIEVSNPDGVCHGVRSLVLNGETLEGNLLPAEKLGEHNRVEIILG